MLIKVFLCYLNFCHCQFTAHQKFYFKHVLIFFLGGGGLPPTGDPGQCAVDPNDTGGDGEVQRRAPPPAGSRGEPAGLLPGQAAPAAAGGAGKTHPVSSLAAGGTVRMSPHVAKTKSNDNWVWAEGFQ